MLGGTHGIQVVTQNPFDAAEHVFLSSLSFTCIKERDSQRDTKARKRIQSRLAAKLITGVGKKDKQE